MARADVTTVPHNPEVEASVIGRLLAEPARVGEVVGQLLEPEHFHTAAGRLLYGAIVASYLADDPIDPLVIGEMNARKLAVVWHVDEAAAVRKVESLARNARSGDVLDYARLVKRDADYRELLALADEIRERVTREDDGPEQIAGIVGQRATRVATSSLRRDELVGFGDAGRQYVRDLMQAKAARDQGLELGAYFGIGAIDAFTHGLQPGELLIGAGEPGVGKSAVWWVGAKNFAERQAKRPEGRRVGTLILSLEMSPTPSSVRFASMLTGLSGTDLREGKVTDRDIERIVTKWREKMDLPLWLNYAPTLRASQMRALIVEGIRKGNNIGLVVIDHFRMWDLDRRLRNPIDEDEEKARFLKEQIAKDLNVAVVCLAHTRKPDSGSNGRPKLSDLRGSGQIAGAADFVSFIYRPWMYATDVERDRQDVKKTDAEMIWAKNRHGDGGDANFYFDPAKMFVT